jgi:hypothetical protein
LPLPAQLCAEGHEVVLLPTMLMPPNTDMTFSVSVDLHDGHGRGVSGSRTTSSSNLFPQERHVYS